MPRPEEEKNPNQSSLHSWVFGDAHSADTKVDRIAPAVRKDAGEPF